MRVGAWRQPAGHQLAVGYQRLRSSGRHRRRQLCAGSRLCRHAAQPGGHGGGLGQRHPVRTRKRAGRRHSRGAAAVDGQQRRGVPHRGDPEAGAHRHPRAQGALLPNHGARQGETLQHRPAGSHRAGIFTGAGRGHGGRRFESQGVPRRSRPRGLSQPRRRQLHATHHGLQGNWGR